MFPGATSPTPRTNLERYETTFDPFRHQSSPATAPISINNNSFGLGTGQQMTVLSKSPTPAEQGKDTKNVEIAEIIVGAILGNISFFTRILAWFARTKRIFSGFINSK